MSSFRRPLSQGLDLDIMMPRRQRQTHTTMQGHSSYRNHTPRYPNMPQDFDASYLHITVPEPQHYELTSSYVPASLVRPCLPGDFDYYSGLDGTGSGPLSACDSTTIADISPPQSDAGSDMFAWSAGEPYSAAFPQELTLSSAYDSFPIEWSIQTPSTPPPESLIKAEMNGSQDVTVCENLGPSALQHMRLDTAACGPDGELISRCSKSRRSSPRPLRPSNGRQNSQDSSEDGSSPPKDDEERPNVRTDPLYDTKPDKDGFYHCPHYAEGLCIHKPVTQKCIFA